MANRARPPWWRVIDWKVVLAVGVPAWYAAAAFVVVCEVKASSRPAPRAESPLVEPLPPFPPFPPHPPEPKPRPAAPGGPFAWFAVTGAAIDPRIVPGIPAGPLPGPFVAALVNGGGRVAPEAPGQVWRRVGVGDRAAWAGPPDEIGGWATLGTFVPWRGSPSDAMDRAAVEGKLALVLHVSGSADDEWFADTLPRAFRNRTLANKELGAAVTARYVAAVQKVVPQRSATGPKPHGAIASYFCTPDGRVVHAVPGFVPADGFLAEANWAASLPADDDRAAMRVAHRDRLKRYYGLTLPVDFLPTIDKPPISAASLLAHPGIAELDGIGRVHALLAIDPLPRLEHFYPVVWDQVLSGRGPGSAGKPARK
jgi:hypothetical protein